MVNAITTEPFGQGYYAYRRFSMKPILLIHRGIFAICTHKQLVVASMEEKHQKLFDIISIPFRTDDDKLCTMGMTLWNHS